MTVLKSSVVTHTNRATGKLDDISVVAALCRRRKE